MIPMEMRLGRDIAEELEKNGVAVFRNNSGQPYAIFKLKDIAGAVVSFSTDGSKYIVSTIKPEEAKNETTK